MHITLITVGKYSGISNDHCGLVKVICVRKGINLIKLR